MKKILILLIISLLATGCSTSLVKDESQENHLVEEISRKFEYQNATCKIDGAKIKFSTMNRNDEITIVDEDDDFYYFDNNGLILAIEKDYVRTENETPFEEYTGYTYSYSELFSDYELKNLVHNFEKNDEVKVIDKVKKVLLVEYDGQFGYMYPSDVSDSYIVTRTYKPVEVQPSGGGTSSGGGGGGGNNNPTPPPVQEENESFFDFGYIEKDFHLLAFTKEDDNTVYVPNNEYNKVVAKVLLDGTYNYITLFNYKEQVKVLNYDDNEATVLVHGYSGKIQKEYLRLEGEEEYEAWDGYAYSGAEVFYDYDLTNEMDWFYKNDDIHVIDRIGDVYVVQLTNGTYGYMSVDDVSETYLPTYKPAPTPTPAPSGGGGGGYTPPSQPETPQSSEETGSYM